MRVRNRTLECVIASATLVVFSACADQKPATSPEEAVTGDEKAKQSFVVSVPCTVDVKAGEMSCEPVPVVTGKVNPQFLIVGGQAQYVYLYNDPAEYDDQAEIFSADVYVVNLMGTSLGVGQFLGTTDGYTPTGVRVFFHTQPYVVSGSGTVTVRNPDGTGTFTASNQPYHEYTGYVLPPGYEVGPKLWEWNVPTTVNTFAFEVYVEADVPHPDGYVLVNPLSAALTVGGGTTLSATIRDKVNRVVGGTVTWSSEDPTIASVNPSTGAVSANAGGRVRIIGSSSGIEDDGAAIVMVFQSGYQIEVEFMSSMTSSQEAAFTSAAARWESHLTGDIPDVSVNTQGLEYCPGGPINETIDDLVIRASIVPIDGPGYILGQAGPCLFRAGTGGLPLYGVMEFDIADVATMETNGTFEDVIKHEMGHVLGFGTLWYDLSLVTDYGLTDPRFNGTNAKAAFQSVGGTPVGTDVPVEATGGLGTAYSHWREDPCGACISTDWFGYELMTGWISGATRPLSVVTIEQFKDLGYPGVTSVGADAFTLNTAGIRAPGDPSKPIQLVDDVWMGPVYRVEADGSITQVLPDRR